MLNLLNDCCERATCSPPSSPRVTLLIAAGSRAAPRCERSMSISREPRAWPSTEIVKAMIQLRAPRRAAPAWGRGQRRSRRLPRAAAVRLTFEELAHIDRESWFAEQRVSLFYLIMNMQLGHIYWARARSIGERRRIAHAVRVGAESRPPRGQALLPERDTRDGNRRSRVATDSSCLPRCRRPGHPEARGRGRVAHWVGLRRDDHGPDRLARATSLTDQRDRPRSCRRRSRGDPRPHRLSLSTAAAWELAR